MAIFNSYTQITSGYLLIQTSTCSKVFKGTIWICQNQALIATSWGE